MEQLFAFAGGGSAMDKESRVAVLGMALIARDKEEARARALEELKRLLPPDAGYRDHKVSIVSFEEEFGSYRLVVQEREVEG